MELLRELRQIASERPRFGYRRLHALLRRRGYRVNHKRVYRLYRQENLVVRRQKRKRVAASLRSVPLPPSRPNERWSMDLMTDALANGRRFRILTLVDDFTRECLAVEVDFSLSGARVARILDRLIAERGKVDTELAPIRWTPGLCGQSLSSRKSLEHGRADVGACCSNAPGRQPGAVPEDAGCVPGSVAMFVRRAAREKVRAAFGMARAGPRDSQQVAR